MDRYEDERMWNRYLTCQDYIPTYLNNLNKNGNIIQTYGEEVGGMVSMYGIVLITLKLLNNGQLASSDILKPTKLTATGKTGTK